MTDGEFLLAVEAAMWAVIGAVFLTQCIKQTIKGKIINFFDEASYNNETLHLSVQYLSTMIV